LKLIYDANHSLRKQSKIPMTIYQDILKDEKLLCEKADRPDKTRLVNACPMDLLIETRRYCMDFCSAMMSSRLDIMCGVGINPRGHEWHDLATRLLTKNEFLFDADYSNFGPGLDSSLVCLVFDVINEWYDYHVDDVPEEDRKIRRIIGHEAAFAYHIVNDTIFQTLKGSPSGHPMTTLINSLVNLLYIMLAWIDATRGKLAAKSFFAHVYVCVYGDDLIGSVSPIGSKYFNAKIFSEFMAKHGIKVTPAEKNGFFKTTGMPIEEVTFLKHSFAKHPSRNVWQSRLDQAIIEDIPNWYRAKDEAWLTENDQIEQLLEQTISFAYSYGVEYYEQVKSKCSAWASKNNILLKCKSWMEYDEQCYEGKYDVDLEEFFDLV
jgi:hypothetical protein